MNVYIRADAAIQEMNRQNIRAFDKLHLIQGKDMKLIREIHEVYEVSRRKAKQRYYEIAFEAYLIALSLCGISGKKASEMAEDAIDDEWVEMLLTDPDPVALYSFLPEAERKEARLIEAVSVAEHPDEEIDKALRYWTRQVGQFALNATDRAMLDAYEDAGITEVMWNTATDERVCEECQALDGQVFPIQKLPKKPHVNCRCYWTPVTE